jgi:hypothetical protein
VRGAGGRRSAHDEVGAEGRGAPERATGAATIAPALPGPAAASRREARPSNRRTTPFLVRQQTAPCQGVWRTTAKQTAHLDKQLHRRVGQLHEAHRHRRRARRLLARGAAALGGRLARVAPAAAEQPADRAAAATAAAAPAALALGVVAVLLPLVLAGLHVVRLRVRDRPRAAQPSLAGAATAAGAGVGGGPQREGHRFKLLLLLLLLLLPLGLLAGVAATVLAAICRSDRGRGGRSDRGRGGRRGGRGGRRAAPACPAVGVGTRGAAFPRLGPLLVFALLLVSPWLFAALVRLCLLVAC